MIATLTARWRRVALAVCAGIASVAAPAAAADTVDARNFGVRCDGVTDVTAGLQRAIDTAAGQTVYVPAGSGACIVSTTLTYRTSGHTPGLQLVGDGMRRTVFDNRVAGGPMIAVVGAVKSYTFQYGARLADFSIVGTATRPGGHAIDARGVWFLDIQRLRIDGMSGDAIRLSTSLGDGDAPSNVTIRHCELRNNGGWGVNFNTSRRIINTGFVDIANNQIVGNQAGGIRWIGLDGTIALNSISTNGGQGGLHVQYNEGGPQNLLVTSNEFDSNAGAHIRIDSGFAFEIVNNQFNFQHEPPAVAYGPVRGIVVGDGKNPLANVRIANSRVRSTPPVPPVPVTMFEVARNAHYTFITDTSWPSFGGATGRRFADSGVNTTIRDDGAWVLGVVGNVSVETRASYAPNLLAAVYHRVVVTAAGTFRIEAPANGASAGRELILDVYNHSPGVVQLEFARVFATRFDNSPGLAISKRRTARFIYDGSSWVQVGQWSPDL